MYGSFSLTVLRQYNHSNFVLLLLGLETTATDKLDFNQDDNQSSCITVEPELHQRPRTLLVLYLYFTCTIRTIITFIIINS